MEFSIDLKNVSNELYKIIGAELKRRRRAHSKTLTNLSSVCSISYISKIENGKIIPNVAGRNNERVQYFSPVTNADGTTSCAGLHQIGGRFGYHVDWEYFDQTGVIKVATDIGSLSAKYADLVRQAVDYTQYLQTSNLLNVTAFPATIDTKKAEVMRISSAFINRAIVGAKNLDSDWDAMLRELDNAGYRQVKAVMTETALQLGIIE
jgi:hypothetical protein